MLAIWSPTLRTASHWRWPRRHCSPPSARLTTSDPSRSRRVCCCRLRPSPLCFRRCLQTRDDVFLPFWAERAILFLAGLWFVNLVNFMDGIDWITVAEVVPVTLRWRHSGLPASSHPGRRSSPPRSAAPILALLRSTARWQRSSWATSAACRRVCCWHGACSISATHGQPVAALLLPLYYLIDATLTLLRRLSRGEKVWLAHRSHFYQQATDNGFSVSQVVGHVFALNLVLAALAGLAVATTSTGSADRSCLRGFGRCRLRARKIRPPPRLQCRLRTS